MDRVIYLEIDEEITSVIDKLKRSKSPLVGIVAPRNAGLLQSIVNLKLLKKEADHHGKQIALVTADPVGQNLALRTGITVFANVHDTEPIAAPAQPRPDDIIEASDNSPANLPSGIQVHNYRQPSASPLPATTFATHTVAVPTPPPASPPPEPTPTKSIEDKLTDRSPAPDKEFQSPELSEEPPTKQPAPPDEPTEPTPLILSDNSQNDNPIITTPITSSSPAPTNRKQHYRQIALALILVILIIAGGLGALLIFPKAVVTLTVPTTPDTEPITVTVAQSKTTIDPENAIIPGRLLESVQTSTTKVKATGKKDTGTKATGKITVTNETGIAQPFDANTAFYSTPDNLIFRADKAFSVPAATAKVDANGNPVITKGTVDVAVTAEESGEKYNLAAGSYTLTGLTKVYGQGSAMTGGLTKEVTVISQDDVNNGRSVLVQTLYQQGNDDLKQKAGESTLLAQGIVNSIVETNISAEVDTEAKDFTLTVKTKSSSLTFDNQSLGELINSILKAKTPAGKLLLPPTKEYSTTVVSADPTVENLKLSVTTNARLAPTIDESSLKRVLAGKSKTEAENYLHTQPVIAAVNVQLVPTWWLKRVPTLSNRIDIKVEYQ